MAGGYDRYSDASDVQRKQLRTQNPRDSGEAEAESNRKNVDERDGSVSSCCQATGSLGIREFDVRTDVPLGNNESATLAGDGKNAQCPILRTIAISMTAAPPMSMFLRPKRSTAKYIAIITHISRTTP